MVNLNLLNMDNSQIKFGAYNTITKESLEGYIDDCQMKFKPYPWYNRLWFGMKEVWNYKPLQPPLTKTATKYIGTTTLYRQMIWSKHKNYFEAAVYSKYDITTGKTISVYSDVNDRRIYFNVDAYNNDKLLIV